MPDTADAQVLPIGHRILWYEIEAILGKGGFGITYRAHDTNLNLPVAIKEYFPSMFASRRSDGLIVPVDESNKSDFEWGLSRFIDEGRTLAQFDHAGIVRVFSVFEENGTAYLVMRYEKGRALDQILKQSGTLPEESIKRILLDVISGLVPVHEAGFIHRDIKPANIYIREDGSSVLIDFGSARQALGAQTQTLTTLVSPGYAPFEQYYSDGTQQGPWTDIYALGATAYRAMTGRSPLAAVDRSRAELANTTDQITEALTSLDGYSREFVEAISWAIAFREGDRPQTVLEWRGRLEGVGIGAAAATSVDIDLDMAPTALVSEIEDVTEKITEVRTEILDDSSPLPFWKRRRTLVGAVALALVVLLVWRPEHDADDGGPKDATPLSNRAIVPADEPPVVAPIPSPESVAPITDAGSNTDDRNSELLDRADRHFAAGRYTRPPGRNALDVYREVLAQDPFNEPAAKGIENIVLKNIERARQAADGKDYYLARAYLDEAAIADPTHPDLFKAREALAARTEATPVRAEPQPAASSLADTAIEGAEKLTDPRTQKQVRRAKQALQKQDYSKALKHLIKGFNDK